MANAKSAKASLIAITSLSQSNYKSATAGLSKSRYATKQNLKEAVNGTKNWGHFEEMGITK